MQASTGQSGDLQRKGGALFFLEIVSLLMRLLFIPRNRVWVKASSSIGTTTQSHGISIYQVRLQFGSTTAPNFGFGPKAGGYVLSVHPTPNATIPNFHIASNIEERTLVGLILMPRVLKRSRYIQIAKGNGSSK